MFARATSGDKKNNRKFSPCSLKSVKQVLTAKARGFRGCFIGECIQLMTSRPQLLIICTP